MKDLENEEEIFLLAVYGTLKENFPNYFYYLNPKKPIFRGLVELPYQMHSDGGFPLLFPTDKSNKIHIEVFEVQHKILEKIDRLEGVPDLYTRETIFIEELGYKVFLYVIKDKEPFGEVIEDGRYE
ncbi:MAG: gamma-glutamylcyclotransferase [Candidatus Heimdallarchaeota archaeon]|nr:gamma-glutamylcyclotransferase [Candidatus Heimdallarchaeota archaeon]MBY8994589.1 gamma-glutamylcyclotransferase [Candidatus Heimdallarchaeota archaeon]